MFSWALHANLRLGQIRVPSRTGCGLRRRLFLSTSCVFQTFFSFETCLAVPVVQRVDFFFFFVSWTTVYLERRCWACPFVIGGDLNTVGQIPQSFRIQQNVIYSHDLNTYSPLMPSQSEYPSCTSLMSFKLKSKLNIRYLSFLAHRHLRLDIFSLK